MTPNARAYEPLRFSRRSLKGLGGWPAKAALSDNLLFVSNTFIKHAANHFVQSIIFSFDLKPNLLFSESLNSLILTINPHCSNLSFKPLAE
jgi:hypothetical protein